MESGLSSGLLVQENIFLIDWLTVTFKHETPTSLMLMLDIDRDLFQEKHSFINGYPVDTFFSNIHIRWGADDPSYYKDSVNSNGVLVTAAMKARNDMGVCLDLSGKGCRAFEEHSKISWDELFKRILQHDGHVTRLDLAYDDHMGVLDIHRIAADVRDRNYISKSRKSMIIWSDDQDENIQGLTVEVGSKSSDVLIRIYDKAAERGFDHSRHWIRVETQLRDDRAGEALRQLFSKESIGRVTAGILRNYLVFVVPSADSNKSRWPIAYYWQRVLGQMESIALWSAPGGPYDFHKAEGHLVQQYCQFLLAYEQIYGSLHDLALAIRRANGGKPLKPKYVNAVNEHFSSLRRSGAISSKGCNGVQPHFSNENFNFLYDFDAECPW